MKKNKIMRIASVLLVAVLLSTCAISGTFAKYVTTKSVNDSARVAHFGVTLLADSDAFGDAYAAVTDATNGNKQVAYATAGTTVKAGAAGTNVLAPGTKGELGSFSMTGTPEVAVRIDLEVVFEIGDNWVDADGYFYCPIVITEYGGTKLKGTDYTTAEEFETAVEDAIATKLYMDSTTKTKDGFYTKDVNPNALAPCNVLLNWEWAFETGEVAKEKEENNIRDTFLGNKAAGGTEIEIDFSIKCTVTQID